MNIRSIGFNSVYDSGYQVCRKPEKGEFTLILLKSRANLCLKGVNVKAPSDTAILFDDSEILQYSADDGFFVCDWICFDADGDKEFFDSLELEMNVPIRFLDIEFMSGIIRNIATEYYSLTSRRVKMLDSLLKTLLIKFGETGDRSNSAQQTAEPHYSALIELRAKIYRNPQLKWNVDTMSADVNMSRSYFQHIYREMFGVSCISDVISGKIEKAKEILSETSCTVSQVASMCGYDNEEHFMRQFKKIVGVTPTKYRKNA